MMGFISKLFGGNKSEKDVKLIEPVVTRINEFFAAYQTLTNDELRAKTIDFKDRIKQHLSDIDADIARLKQEAEEMPVSEMQNRDVAYQEIDKLVKDRDTKIEERSHVLDLDVNYFSNNKTTDHNQSAAGIEQILSDWIVKKNR